MTVKLNANIRITDDGKRRFHSKASEEYIHVQFNYTSSTWDGWVPVEYRRTGVHIKSIDELHEHLNYVYEQLRPENFENWLVEQNLFWIQKSKATVTKGFFDCLMRGGWQCVECMLPKNPNWARRIQDLKEFGYTLATDTKRRCIHCDANKTHLLLLPIERGCEKGLGYETWSPALRKRILKVLNNFDVYEYSSRQHLLPDHKFSEIRWDSETKSENPNNMTDEEIRQKFQLLPNQRNQQKREICRICTQTGKRGVIFGIPYFYEGNENWDKNISKKGKEAELGCVGCAWYDIAKWRESLIKTLEKGGT